MTIRTGTDAYGHHSHLFRPTRMPGPVWQRAASRWCAKGSSASLSRAKPARGPLSERHAVILELVGAEPTEDFEHRQDAWAHAPERRRNTCTRCPARGLVERVPYKGWVRV